MLSHEDLKKLRTAAEGREGGEPGLHEAVVKDNQECLCAWDKSDPVTWMLLYVVQAHSRFVQAEKDCVDHERLEEAREDRRKAVAMLQDALD
jgi:hypothetical protein